jgi:two-component system response regulator YesN
MDTYNCKELIDGCVCIDVKIKDNQEEENYKKVYELVQNQNNDNMITFVHFMHNIIIYFVNKDLDECINYAEALHKKLNKIGITATIGISGENIGFCGIASAYGQADKALGVSVLLGRNRVVTYSEYQEVMKQNNSKIELDWDKFAEAINNCREEEMLKYIKDYIEVIKKGKIADEEYLKLMTMTIILRAGSTLNKYGINLYQLINEEDVFKDVRAIRSVTDALECAKEYIKIVYDYHNQKKSKRNKNVIEDALEYVNRNLYNSELSLKKAATDLYINESYLSREFKKTYGVSFIEYVSEKRIEASKKILKQTDLKVYEVAEKVGFKDSHYFCICFKKQTGKTVKEYRC